MYHYTTVHINSMQYYIILFIKNYYTILVDKRRNVNIVTFRRQRLSKKTREKLASEYNIKLCSNEFSFTFHFTNTK